MTGSPAARDLRAAIDAARPLEPDAKAIAAVVDDLRAAGWLDLPLPGGGATLDRWEALAEVAAVDLAAARLVEGHLEAQALHAEAGRTLDDGLWNVWAALPGSLRASRIADGWRLDGVKRWCSGARGVQRAVVSAQADGEDGVRLFAIDVREPVGATQLGAEPPVTFDDDSWRAVGMALSDTLDATIDGLELAADAEIGEGAGWFTARAGYFTGALAVAATWYGGALGIARTVRQVVVDRGDDPHGLAHLGWIDAAIDAMHTLLADAARVVDDDPQDRAAIETSSRRVRLMVEELCQGVIRRAGRAHGSGPYCHDAEQARRMADLPVYLRQHHAEADLAKLGGDALRQGRLT